MTQRFVDLEDGRIFVRDDGPRDAPAMLLLHSLFFDGTMFDALCDALHGQFRVIRPDHRGQGRSLVTQRPPGMDQLAADMIALLEQLETGPVYLVGSSMGAYVAMRMLGQRPDLFAQCALLCCTAQAEQNPTRFLGLVQRLRQETPAAMVEVIARTMFGDAFLSDPAREAERRTWLAGFAALPTSVAEAAAQVFTRDGNEALLAAHRAPLLLVGGALDRAKRPEDMAHIATLVPGSRVVIVPDAGHTPAIETPSFLAETLRAWWTENTPAAAPLLS